MNTYILTADGELYHHGIQGQKWGVRRYQKQDGSLTVAGKKRYNKSSHRSRLEDKYRRKGLSKEEAERAASRRIRTEKIVAGAAAATVVACTAYYAKNKWTADHVDQVLSKGTTFHNLDSAANPRPGEHLYVNYRKDDTHFFRGKFAVNKLRKTGQVFDHSITAVDDVKIPSLNTRKSVFKQLYDSDPEFRETMKQHSRLKGPISANVTYKNMWPLFGDKNNPEFNKAKSKYFEALKQKGYDAIVDELDSRPSVFRSNAPLILLDTSSKSLGEMKISELTDREILISQANSYKFRKRSERLSRYYLPHANNFKESERRLSKHAARNAKNTAYIDKAISELTKKGDNDRRRNVFRQEGKVLADAGRYISKNEKMSIDTAMRIARSKKTASRAVNTVEDYASIIVPIGAVGMMKNNIKINNYRNEHPNTTLTNKEILQLVNKKR